MICSEVIYSQVIMTPVYSEVDEDYRVLDEVLRLTENNEVRKTQDDDLRTLEDEP